jgi:hypothetical protein
MSAPPHADFALIDVGPLPKMVNQTRYYEHGGLIEIGDYMPREDLTEGDVWIIAANGRPATKGYLLAGDASIILRGNVMRTKKIQVEHPGGKALLAVVMDHC